MQVKALGEQRQIFESPRDLVKRCAGTPNRSRAAGHDVPSQRLTYSGNAIYTYIVCETLKLVSVNNKKSPDFTSCPAMSFLTTSQQ